MPPYLTDAQAQETIRVSIEEGIFTPFLGAGAASLRPASIPMEALKETPWIRAVHDAYCVRTKLEETESVSNNVSSNTYALKFFHRFAINRLPINKEIWDQIDKRTWKKINEEMSGKNGEKTSWQIEGVELGHCDSTNDKNEKYKNLVSFQSDIVKLAAHLTQVFGRKFAEAVRPVRRISEAKAIIDTETQKGVAGSLMKLIGYLEQPFPIEGTGFKCQDIFRKAIGSKLMWALVELTSEDFRNNDNAVNAFFNENDDLKTALPKEANDLDSDQGVLRLELLEWLSHLLWFTMTYQIKYPPTTDELAFSFSLETPGLTPPRRIDLAQAAQLLPGEEDLSTKIRERVESWYGTKDWMDNRDSSANLYGAIAAAMYVQYLKHKEKNTAKREGGKDVTSSADFDLGDPTMDGQTSATTPLPLVFTTNFDCELEKLFLKERVDHHVVFPIRTGSNQIDWRYKTYCMTKSGHLTGTYKVEEISADDAFTNNMPTEELVGPVIIKLHGSPLTELEKGERKAGKKHHLVLSEAAYLRSMAQEEALPSWVTHQLTDMCPRHFLFMGYSLSDWNVRLELYKSRKLPRYRAQDSQTAMQIIGKRKRSLSWSIVRRPDPIRWKLLEPFDINVYVGELYTIPSIIENTINWDKFHGKAKKIKALLERTHDGNA